MNSPSVLALSDSNQEGRHGSCCGGAKPGCSPPQDVGQGSQRCCWGDARTRLSLVTCFTPQEAATEVGICPKRCRTQGGVRAGSLGSGSLQMERNPWQGEKPHLQVASLSTSFTAQFIFSVLT